MEQSIYYLGLTRSAARALACQIVALPRCATVLPRSGFNSGFGWREKGDDCGARRSEPTNSSAYAASIVREHSGAALRDTGSRHQRQAPALFGMNSPTMTSTLRSNRLEGGQLRLSDALRGAPRPMLVPCYVSIRRVEGDQRKPAPSGLAHGVPASVSCEPISAPCVR